MATSKPCACRSYSFLITVSETPTETVWHQKTTECTDTTQSTYTPGHDAKLRSFLVQAGIEGCQVRRVKGDIIIGKSALRVAAELGWEDAVREGIERRRGSG